MSGYWWGLLTVPITLVLLAAALLVLLGAWMLFWKWADQRFYALQRSKGWYVPRAGVVAYLALAPRAWSVDLARRCSVTIAFGKVADDAHLTRVASAIDDAVQDDQS